MQGLKEKGIKAIVLLAKQSDYLIFLLLYLLKVYILTKYTNSIFFRGGISSYFTRVKEFLFHSASFEELMYCIFLVSLGAGILVSFWVFFLPRRNRIVSLYLLNLVLSIIILSDLIYYRFFWDLVSVDLFMQIGQVSSLGSSIFELFELTDVLFILDSIIFLPLVIWFWRTIGKSAKFKWSSFTLRVFSGVIVLTMGIVLFFYPMYYYVKNINGLLLTKTLSNVHIYNVTGLIGFHAFDMYKAVNRYMLQGEEVAASQQNEIESWFDTHNQAQAETTPYKGIAKDKNVIVIQLEAFQTFVLNRKVNGQEITPNLNKLLKESILFPNFYHQTANGRTSDAEFSVNNSLYPLTTGSAYVRFPHNRYHSLPEILKDNGYDTAAFHAYKPGFWNRHIMYRNIDFNTFYSEKYFNGEKIGWSTNDKDFFSQSADLIKDLDQPFYSFLISITSHYPFDIQDQHKKLNLEGYNDEIFKNYLHTVKYTDEALGIFMEKLKKEKIWDNSIVLLYGDHDSGLISKGSEALRFAGGSDSELDINKIRGSVPLIVHLPDNKGVVNNRAGGQIDLSPSITHLLGIETTKNYRMGENLFRPEGLVSFRNGAFTDGERYFIPSQEDSSFQRGICYDLKNSNQTDQSACEAGYNETELRLQISDILIDKDYLKD
jgi:lipoteichoic acid synthase